MANNNDTDNEENWAPIPQPDCHCGSGRVASWEYDARGIPLCKACDGCRDEKLRGYRSDVLTDSQYECDEAIEPEDY